MAFCNKVGSLLRHSVSQNGQASITSMLNYVRYMSSSKLFIGGLSYSTDDQSLKDAFAGFGEVVEARVIIDRETGRSRGFGFINYSSDEPATSAMSAMDGQELNGQNIRVSYANDSPAGPRSIGSGGGYDGGGGGGGGGYGGGRGFGGGDGGY